MSSSTSVAGRQQQQQQVLVHCPCSSGRVGGGAVEVEQSRAPASSSPLAELEHHALSSLLFCEECDGVRCDACVTREVACYYCPNCLFEVPSASVRAERNRCARNCFQCPSCDHTLAVVASDSSDPTLAHTSAAASAGEPPYFLQCLYCLWDSKQVGITFDKPTGLSQQLQKSDDTAPEMAEFNHLHDHFEPYLRRGLVQQANDAAATTAPATTSSSTPATSSAAVAAASRALSTSSLLKDVTSSRYGNVARFSHRRQRSTPAPTPTSRDELEPYDSLFPTRKTTIVRDDDKVKGKAPVIDSDRRRVEAIENLNDIEHVTRLQQRWTTSWDQPFLQADLKPIRTPLQAKWSKRCPTCKHILAKPEQKSTSTRFKIKLVAQNYLPLVQICRKSPALLGSRLSAIAAASSSSGTIGRRSSIVPTTTTAVAGSTSIDDEPLRPGRTYTFEVTFTNPLYELIQVKLAIAEPESTSTTTTTSAVVDESERDDGTASLSSPPFAVNLPTSFFEVSAFAEEWEYEQDYDAMDLDPPAPAEGCGGGENDQEGMRKRPSRFGLGVLERKMNSTRIAMDVIVAKHAVGPLKANMLVTYYYQAEETEGQPRGGAKVDETEDSRRKSFSFWTLCPLGTVVPRPAAVATTTMSRLAESKSDLQ
ncbi:hypothetical protein ACM66B_003631 [Microbotryomycetes sp. NB124-2]